MKFPLLQAYLICPNKENGRIGICTNYLAPGMVLNEIPLKLRKDICAMGPLIVNRGGAERMIVNSLVHRRLKYLILFGKESVSFKPSSNLLLALMNGYEEGEGNYIKASVGLGAQYPNISEKVLNSFRKNIIVLPIFGESREIVDKYLHWIKHKISKEIFDCLKSINKREKIYYDSLLSLIGIIPKASASEKKKIKLIFKDFKYLQPEIIILEDVDQIGEVNFGVRGEGKEIVVDIDFGENSYSIRGEDTFLLAYSLVKFMNENNLQLPIRQQLVLGAEISRIEMEVKHNLFSASIIKSKCKSGPRKEIPLASQAVLKEDKKYYYSISLKKGYICVQVITYDTCRYIFELRAKSVMTIINKLSEENRFQDYTQQALHRIDVGIEIKRAEIALKNNKVFLQDFHYLSSVNKTDFPLFVIDGDSFLANHKKIIISLYTRGVTQRHPDAHKGPMRSGAVLCVFRNPKEALKRMPKIYVCKGQSEREVREKYKEQLLNAESFGSYTYGNRTRHYFKKDQIKETINSLKKNPNSPFIIQRFDYVKDMTIQENDKENELRATHDPCLTHDIYFISGNRLYSFHIARAHNIIYGYPMNLFGLYDAYDQSIAQALNLESGDIFMLSSRANILLLTEEQEAKTIIREPSKPLGAKDTSVGPHNIRNSFYCRGVGYCEGSLKKQGKKPEHLCLKVLENYDGVNILEKAVNYLKLRGGGHNNPIIGTYNPKQGKLNEENRLIYFQANVVAGKIQATAVFLNGSKEKFQNDIELCEYLATQYSKRLNIDLGKLFFFYVPIKNN